MRAALLAGVAALAIAFAPAAIAATDYAALRAKAEADPGFNGYAATMAERDLVDELAATRSTSPASALARLESYAKANPYSILANRMLAEAYQTVLDGSSDIAPRGIAGTQAPLYRAAYEGLVASVLASGDGRSCATAYHVITVNEEYEVLNWMNVESDTQSLIRDGARVCDSFRATGDDWVVRDIYFDIGTFFGKL